MGVCGKREKREGHHGFESSEEDAGHSLGQMMVWPV